MRARVRYHGEYGRFQFFRAPTRENMKITRTIDRTMTGKFQFWQYGTSALRRHFFSLILWCSSRSTMSNPYNRRPSVPPWGDNHFGDTRGLAPPQPPRPPPFPPGASPYRSREMIYRPPSRVPQTWTGNGGMVANRGVEMQGHARQHIEMGGRLGQGRRRHQVHAYCRSQFFATRQSRDIISESWHLDKESWPKYLVTVPVREFTRRIEKSYCNSTNDLRITCRPMDSS